MSHSLTQIWIHVVFSTKDRQLFLKNTADREHLYRYLCGIAKKCDCPLLAIGGAEDHIHLLTHLSKNIALSDFIETLKASSSKWIKSINNADSAQLKNFYWQTGYAAFSVSQSNLHQVKNYINHQMAHHQKYSFEHELEELLKRHHIIFKKSYLLD